MKLGGSLDQGWIFKGCKEGVVDLSYVGELNGLICKWERKERTWVRIRYESFLWGKPHRVEEKLRDAGGTVAEGVIQGSGNRFYRTMEFYKRNTGRVRGRERDRFELEVISGGRVLCVYRMSRKPAVLEGKIWAVSKDTQLIEGAVCPDVEAVKRQGE